MEARAVISIILNFVMCVVLIKYLEAKTDLDYFREKYKQVKHQYAELHEQFYEPECNIKDGVWHIGYRLKDEYQVDKR